MPDATEGVVAAIAATGGNDEVVFAARDWIAKDDLGGDDVAFKDFRMLDNLCLVETTTIALFQPKALESAAGYTGAWELLHGWAF